MKRAKMETLFIFLDRPISIIQREFTIIIFQLLENAKDVSKICKLEWDGMAINPGSEQKQNLTLPVVVVVAAASMYVSK